MRLIVAVVKRHQSIQQQEYLSQKRVRGDSERPGKAPVGRFQRRMGDSPGPGGHTSQRVPQDLFVTFSVTKK